jgi:hypothetical protein
MDVLRLRAPPQGWLDDYRRDGFYALPDALTARGREALAAEVMNDPRTADMLAQLEQPDSRTQMTLRPWDTMCDRPGETAQDALLDAPLIRAMLGEVMGTAYTFCHSGFSLRCPGAPTTPMHQDFAYGPAPYSAPEHSPKSPYSVVQILYYPTGFTRGDTHLRVMPGSHEVSAFDERLEGHALSRGSEHETALTTAPFDLAPLELELPPGSFVFLNGRCFHGVAPKPQDSPERARLFVFYVFKNGPMHRHTAPIPPEWIPTHGHRRMLLDRTTNWEEQKVSRTWDDHWNMRYCSLEPRAGAAPLDAQWTPPKL